MPDTVTDHDWRKLRERIDAARPAPAPVRYEPVRPASELDDVKRCRRCGDWSIEGAPCVTCGA